jgi:hypothetical protein
MSRVLSSGCDTTKSDCLFDKCYEVFVLKVLIKNCLRQDKGQVLALVTYTEITMTEMTLEHRRTSSDQAFSCLPPSQPQPNQGSHGHPHPGDLKQ